MLALLTLPVQDDEYIEQPDRWKDMDVLLPKKKQDIWQESDQAMLLIDLHLI